MGVGLAIKLGKDEEQGYDQYGGVCCLARGREFGGLPGRGQASAGYGGGWQQSC